jgi:hypothetical protein
VAREMKKRRLMVDEKLVSKRQVRIGSNECTLLAALGEPVTVNRTVTRNAVSKQFVFGDDRIYVYTENGRVRAWQD